MGPCDFVDLASSLVGPLSCFFAAWTASVLSDESGMWAQPGSVRNKKSSTGMAVMLATPKKINTTANC